MASLLSTVGSLCSFLPVDLIKQQLSYLFEPEGKFQNLKDKLQSLKDAKERLKQSVLDATRNGEEIYSDVDRWLTAADEKIQAIDQFLQTNRLEVQERCFSGLFPNFMSRYQLSKKAEEETNAIAALLLQRNLFDKVAQRPVLQGAGIKPVKHYKSFKSRKGALKRVMKALKDDNFQIIGVYGMGGVGKTTLVQEVGRQAFDMFKEVIFVTVKQTPNISNIQNEIAEKLGMQLNEASVDLRAARLLQRLKKEKKEKKENKENKVLVILDDIWATLDLEALGIPSTEEHHGCKILMTSRKLNVLQSMESQVNVGIDTLEEDEAWNLFKNMAGPMVERPDFQSTAIEVSKKCAGLPLAITAVARALKNRNLSAWQHALEKLPGDDVHSAIELSYNVLERELRLTFLLCSIMGPNADIDDLLKYGRGVGLFYRVNTIKKMRNEISTMVSDLKDSSLLLAGSSTSYSECFDMHDVVREVALKIASRDYGWLVLGREDVFEEWSDEGSMRNCNLLSLPSAKLPDGLECPNLTFFSMSVGEPYFLPDKFFNGMQGLKVLKFSNTKISLLPSSIHCLKNIRTLCFSDCGLNDIAIIGELENLEILSLCGSAIVKLPKEIEQLTKLKLLDLSRCSSLEVIWPDVLSNLSRLEELYLYSFDGWEVEHDHSNRSNASLVELQHLSHLTTLEAHIPNERAIPNDNLLFLDKLERYKISIGERWKSREDQLETSRMLKLKMDKSIHMYDGVKILLRKSETLHLLDVKDIEDMLYDPNTAGLSQLKHLHVENVSKIKYISDPMKFVTFKVFPVLESLSLSNLDSLEAISYGELKAESFGQLRVIKVVKCEMLKNLFSSSMVNCFVQLKRLVVKECRAMEEVIAEEAERSSSKMVFPKLDFLELTNLRSLKRFCSTNIPIEFPILKQLKMYDCSVLKTFHCDSTTTTSAGNETESISVDVPQYLFNEKVELPMLEKLTIYAMPKLERIWANQLDEESFGKLIHFELKYCDKVVNVFPFSMITRLQKLKTLFIMDCVLVEEIFEYFRQACGTNSAVQSSLTFEFLQLTTLLLVGLPKLRSLYKKIYCAKFPSLKEMTVRRCDNVEVLFAPQLETCSRSGESQQEIPIQQPLFWVNTVALPMLEKLRIYGMPKLERIWANQFAEESFGNLIHFELEYCGKVVNVFSLSMVIRLQRLKTLYIMDCKLVEEIFEYFWQVGGMISAVQSSLTFEFPQLITLRLIRLPKLRSLYKEIYSAKFPSLKEMNAWGCDNVEMLFAFQLETCFGYGESQQEIPIRPPLFWVNKSTFPNLQKVSLGFNKVIWRGYDQQLASHYFCNLRDLHFVGSSPKLTTFPSEYIQFILSFPNLEKLGISICHLKEIFQSEELAVGGEEKPSSTWVLRCPPLTELKLRFLYELMHLWKEKEVFPNLRLLSVSSCHKLQGNLVSSSVSFQNLVTLQVSKCDGIIKLVTHSTAKSLVQLKNMEIMECKNMEEIVGEGDDDEVKDEISFPKLQDLKLQLLEKLESFCSSGNFTFGFPSLATVDVYNCPNMKMFSQGESKTPMLHNVKFLTDGKYRRWERSRDDSKTPMLHTVKFLVDGNYRRWERSRDDSKSI